MSVMYELLWLMTYVRFRILKFLIYCSMAICKQRIHIHTYLYGFICRHLPIFKWRVNKSITYLKSITEFWFENVLIVLQFLNKEYYLCFKRKQFYCWKQQYFRRVLHFSFYPLHFRFTSEPLYRHHFKHIMYS